MHALPDRSISRTITALELELLARDALQLVHSADTARFEALFTADARLRCSSGAAFDGRSTVARELRRRSLFRRRLVTLEGVVVLEPFVLLHSGPHHTDRGTPFAVLEVCDGAIASWIEDCA
ncbi:hypothetical protein ITJ64_13805 [Herbiconiux sp. VKM Ac-1786]|uniref:hypothetical protein n=1 Tax=Herbiconiux sp. VKM Ac-1786 TaxID=2783824 RepID=UPI00188B9BC0|nr:hypothetical protein [Herbiconiux sp. VKM Ac-1786]MBF4573596.1 hypothetical protein [Herbiconiux sp. VKM Ac-1786]